MKKLIILTLLAMVAVPCSAQSLADKVKKGVEAQRPKHPSQGNPVQNPVAPNAVQQRQVSEAVSNAAAQADQMRNTDYTGQILQDNDQHPDQKKVNKAGLTQHVIFDAKNGNRIVKHDDSEAESAPDADVQDDKNEANDTATVQQQWSGNFNIEGNNGRGPAKAVKFQKVVNNQANRQPRVPKNVQSQPQQQASTGNVERKPPKITWPQAIDALKTRGWHMVKSGDGNAIQLNAANQWYMKNYDMKKCTFIARRVDSEISHYEIWCDKSVLIKGTPPTRKVTKETQKGKKGK